MGFIAAPDGTLFVAAGGSLYRRLPEGCADRLERECWKVVAKTPEPILRLYAPSRDVVFALPRSNVIYQWEERTGAMQAHAMPVADSVLRDGHYARSITVYDLWGTSATNVYAVGELGIIQHFDGERWALEPNPLVPAPGPRPPDAFRRDLWAVGVAGGQLFAAGPQIVRHTESGWVIHPRPGAMDADAVITAIAGADGRLTVGGTQKGKPFLARQSGGVWEDLSPRLTGFREMVFAGRGLPDGSALFWDPFGAVALVSRGSMEMVHVPLLSRLYAAQVVGDRMYAAGVMKGKYVVLRGPATKRAGSGPAEFTSLTAAAGAYTHRSLSRQAEREDSGLCTDARATLA
jgi:hypothetical protein